MKTLTKPIFPLSVFAFTKTHVSSWLILALALLLTYGCSGGGSSGDGGQPPEVNTLSTAVPISVSAPLTLTAGVPVTTQVYLELPANFNWGQLSEASIDPTATLSNITIIRTDGGTSPSPTVDLSLLVAAGNDVGACSSGTQAFRAEITGSADFSSSSISAGETTMPQNAVDIINSGSFTLCTSATSSVDANLTTTGIGLSFGFAANCATSQDLAGVWVGDYTCNDNCQGSISSESGSVEITIAQSGGTAIYQDDSGATYIGSVCETSFSHLGLGGGYFESGTFTRTGPTTATKSSTWVSTSIPQCGGTCSDTLTLTSN